MIGVVTSQRCGCRFDSEETYLDPCKASQQSCSAHLFWKIGKKARSLKRCPQLSKLFPPYSTCDLLRSWWHSFSAVHFEIVSFMILLDFFVMHMPCSRCMLFPAFPSKTCFHMKFDHFKGMVWNRTFFPMKSHPGIVQTILHLGSWLHEIISGSHFSKFEM